MEPCACCWGPATTRGRSKRAVVPHSLSSASATFDGDSLSQGTLCLLLGAGHNLQALKACPAAFLQLLPRSTRTHCPREPCACCWGPDTSRGNSKRAVVPCSLSSAAAMFDRDSLSQGALRLLLGPGHNSRALKGQIEELGNSNPSTRLISHHSTISYSQEDLIALVVDLKEEVKDLKTLISEVLTLLRSKSYYRETPIMHKTESNADIGLNEEPVIRKNTLSRVNSISDQNIIAPQIGPISLPNTKIDSGAPTSSRPCAVFVREAPIVQTLYQPKGSGYPIFMCRVPPSVPNAQEDRASLINKVTHWIRYNRQCGSIIHSDIISAQPYPESEGHLDIIKLVLSTPELVRGLLSLEMRNPLQTVSNICFKSCWPAEDSLTRSNLPAPNPSLRLEKENPLVIYEETSFLANKKEHASQNVLSTSKRLVQASVGVDTD
ncbi:hypothetical protein NDU88_002408 [Pleurodeles waltl]|uniref:Uncharacterized protein n=1 Tax=Pleurodeles waltl TaxID=8319 RepID=A0AAV7MMN3_PLEWA|nr:hypothetical protein NDU88_002408 [Pleurodeles waltl]